jgi:hypothetical protein
MPIPRRVRAGRWRKWCVVGTGCLLLAASTAADAAPQAGKAVRVFVFTVSASGVPTDSDGCPVVNNAEFDPRLLCAPDLGPGWFAGGTLAEQACSATSPIAVPVLVGADLEVSEILTATASAQAATTEVDGRVAAYLACARGGGLVDATVLSQAAPAGASAGVVLRLQTHTGVFEVQQLAVVGSTVLRLNVAAYKHAVDPAVVQPIVATAIDRFNHPNATTGHHVVVSVATDPLPSSNSR